MVSLFAHFVFTLFLPYLCPLFGVMFLWKHCRQHSRSLSPQQYIHQASFLQMCIVPIDISYFDQLLSKVHHFQTVCPPCSGMDNALFYLGCRPDQFEQRLNCVLILGYINSVQSTLKEVKKLYYALLVLVDKASIVCSAALTFCVTVLIMGLGITLFVLQLQWLFLILIFPFYGSFGVYLFTPGSTLYCNLNLFSFCFSLNLNRFTLQLV